jgi:hypothetical protein
MESSSPGATSPRRPRRDGKDLTAADPSLASRFPYLIEVVEELGASGYDYTGQFERGLELILDGIEQLRHSAKVERASIQPKVGVGRHAAQADRSGRYATHA